MSYHLVILLLSSVGLFFVAYDHHFTIPKVLLSLSLLYSVLLVPASSSLLPPALFWSSSSWTCFVVGLTILQPRSAHRTSPSQGDVMCESFQNLLNQVLVLPY